MKHPDESAESLLDVAFAPEAEALLDELERSGQFRIGVEAELDEADGSDSASNDYSLARGSGSIFVQDWWTTGRVVLVVAAGIQPSDLALARVDDSLVVRTQDGLDRVTFDGYLGLIPDASTLRIIFDDGSEWAGEELRSRITAWVAAVTPSSSAPNH
jgi:hypothetical protein